MKRFGFATLAAVTMLAACDQPPTIVGPSTTRPNLAISAATDSVLVFSNFGPGRTFNPSLQFGYTINGFINPQVGEQAISNRFVPSSNVTFVTAQVAVAVASGPPSIRAVLQADANGSPGAILEDIPLLGLQSVPNIHTAVSTLRPQLRSGTPYWLTVVAGAPGVIGVWNLNSIGDMGIMAVTGTGTPLGPWSPGFGGSTRGAFQIMGLAPTVQDALGFLVESVSGLVANGTVNKGEGNALLAKLSAAIASLDRENVHAACGQLDAFVNQVSAFQRTGRLTGLQAQPLLDLALEASSRLGCV